ncbi:MAG: hypothetical protein WD896_01245 [Parcubacteria group bacterium]
MNNIDQKILELEERLKKLEQLLSKPSEVQSTKGKKISAREFLKTKPAADKVTGKALALGYYLEHVEGMTSFNVGDLESVFRAAKEPLPKNMNDIVNNNIGKGFMDEAKERKDSKKAWYLTSTGEDFIEREASKES